MIDIRCKKCKTLLGKGIIISAQIKCRKCHYLNDFSSQHGIFGYWLAGFIDGEGYFGVDIHKQIAGQPYKAGNGKIYEHKTNSYQFHPVFKVSLRSDDYEILESVQRWLGFGKIALAVKCNNGDKYRSGYYIQTIEDALKLIKIIDQYPLMAKKRYDYQRWREIVLILGEKKHLTEEGGKEKVKKLIDNLKEGRKFENIINRNIINDPRTEAIV